ncbi:MAG TPA: hypothetical protein DCZ94_14735 [Lentisphaeria bacterium]|nr:MAG: hypothetical protein A2X48_02890 [Lentisphaerae bacterium GWF2_49_21]HBC88204.1 hypothetical protein [Lentisphaeria bacterium]
MKRTILMLLALLFAAAAYGQNSVSVPWDEFKKIYRDNIEREIKASGPQEKQKMVFALDLAEYRLSVEKGKVSGKVSLTGKLISGNPVPVPLFGKNFIISKIESASGGTLLCQDDKSVSVLPSDKEPLKLEISFLSPVLEDKESKYISFQIPDCVSNSLVLQMQDGMNIISAPGIASGSDIYCFNGEKILTVRFAEKEKITASRIIEIGTLSVLQIQGRKAYFTANFAPMQEISGSISLRISEKAKFVSTSLNESWIRKTADGSYTIDFPQPQKDVFSVKFAYDEGDFQSIGIPSIQDNTGSEGIFMVEEPEDAEIAISSKSEIVKVSPEKLSPSLRKAMENRKYALKTDTSAVISISLKKFECAAVPKIVLDSVYYFSSFEENGGNLTVLRMNVPAEAGSRLSIKKIPSAEIWSLKVNGSEKKAYSGNDGDWIIPLAQDGSSLVELALLKKGQKLGLYGTLDISIPETGISARNFYMGIALPSRVQLTSLEGPASAAADRKWDPPPEFVGTPYYFSRSFYKGDDMKFSISYREPVNNPK